MIKLNLGCGHTNFGPDWDNIDIIEEPHIKSHDITKLPYADNSVDVIYSSHTLEYFDRDRAIEVLREWYRVLKVGGKIYLSVPDFDALSLAYQEKKMPLHKLLGPLYGKMSSKENIIYHKTVWDYQSLGEYLRIAGFRRLDKWREIKIANEQGVLETVNTNKDCSNANLAWYIPLSLNIVAEKNEYEGKK